MMTSILRAAWRLAVVVASTLIAVAHFGCLCLARRRVPNRLERARWLHRWCRWGLKVMGVELTRVGTLPTCGLVVSNHLSYLDILIFSAAAPAVFVAKVEVRSWPLFGWMALLGGSVFIDRARCRRLPAVIAEGEEVLRQGALLVLFPEATTTDGRVVLPFRPALFEASIRSKSPVASASIAYSSAGNATNEICWHGDMDFAPHFASTLSKTDIEAHLTFSGAQCFTDRKIAALATRAKVLELRLSNSTVGSAHEPQTLFDFVLSRS